ncbi:MAG: recombinase family protein [Eubacteriales bacterium]|nr:recombinase family protein [Eubacteriales bacterium]
MRIGIYNHQHLRGGCPGCSQIYVKGMIKDAVACKNRVEGIYGTDCEYFNFTDLGDYPPSNLDRPGFHRMMKDVENGRLDAIIVIRLDKISNDIDLILTTYQRLKEHNVALLTLKEGEKAMEILEKAMESKK